MEEAVARVSDEAEGMVFCPKLRGMGEREYLFNNAYNGECRKVKRDCCVLGEPEVVPVEGVIRNTPGVVMAGRAIIIPTDPIWNKPFPEEQKVLCIHPDAPERAAAILLRENVLSGQCEICQFCGFQCIYLVSKHGGHLLKEHVPGHGFLYCPEKKKALFMTNMVPAAVVEYCSAEKKGCGWELKVA